MLVICLLAASFTGCLGSDDIVDEVPVEEQETIEPVGTGDNGGNETNNYYYNNDTYYVNGTDYLELISKVENLTAEVEELRLAVEDLTSILEEMQSSKYDVLENSSMIIYHIVENETGQGSGGARHVEPLYGITKEGNTITVDYLGVSRGNTNPDSPVNCSNSNPGLSFYGHDDEIIGSLHGYSPYDYILRDDVEVIMECEHVPATGGSEDQHYDYWSSMIITLPEEPVGVSYQFYHHFD